ncbi:uncharacterized protein LOC143837324 [Paroedura picta]|uniref:uncharacterized protein LOC143837324 n=1 Tax=Paroedura picta TaxID=143630 RepID=UPI004055C929
MKISLGFLLLLLGSALPSPVPEATLPNGHLMYPYGAAEGDTMNPKEDDGTSPKISTTEPFTFYGKTYHDLYVNNNGVVSFNSSVPEYTPKGIPLVDGKAFVAPYWGDVNTMQYGKIWWRENKDPKLLERITKDLKEYFPEIPFNATWAFIATWDHVAYFGSVSKKANTFQCVLTTNGNVSFVILNYGDIQWTTGTASGGNRTTGLGGMSAQAGFNSGNDKNYYSIPGSRMNQIINITKTSNVHVPGRWVFQVDNFKVTGVPKELLELVKEQEKEQEKEKSNEEQGPQSNEPSGAELATTRNLPEEEEPQVNQDNEVNSEPQGQEQMEEMEHVPSGDVHEEEKPQDNEASSEVPGQEKMEELEPVPSGDVHEEEKPQDNEASSEVPGQEKMEELEPVPSGDVHEEEKPQDNEASSEVPGQEKMEELEPVPSEDVHEEEKPQDNQEPLVNQDNEIPNEEGQKEEEENGGASAEDVPERPVQKPEQDTQIDDDSEEYDDDC